jgi:orf33
MPYNYAKLLGRIVEKVGTQGKFAEKVGISERSVSLKLNGKVGWKQDEIVKACKVLAIQDEDIPSYFFAL